MHHFLIIILMEIFVHLPKFRRKRRYNYWDNILIVYADRGGIRDIWDIYKLRKRWGLRKTVLVVKEKPNKNVEKQAILKEVELHVNENPKIFAKLLKQEFERHGNRCIIKTIEDVSERNFTMDPM